MRFSMDGNKRDNALVVVKNAEASATLALGQPVIYDLTSTVDAVGDGVDVVNPSTATAVQYQFGAGILQTANVAPGTFGESLVYGYTPSCLVKLASRATSTDSWSSIAAIASGGLLVMDTSANMWQTLANVAAQSSPQVILLDALASIATLASNAGGTGDTRIFSGGLKRAFVRML